LEIWVRMNAKDYEAGLTDYRELSKLVGDVRAQAPKANVSIWQSDRLHAKCFATERGAIIGSCNLSQAGFEDNIELAVRLETAEVSGRLSIRDVMREYLQKVTQQDWDQFINSLDTVVPVSFASVPGPGTDWESFVQQVVSEGPPQLRTHIR
jgi:phosphatidylserine/phosphatidylglycerophosphate/cardiolipin synthase-like enzyme